MRRAHSFLWVGIVKALVFTFLASGVAHAQVKLVNMIPQSQSGESHQDSEPNLAVNPANPLQIAASAFTPDPMGGPYAPIYSSLDGGNSWSLKSILPGAGWVGTGDITLRFGGTSNVLYAGILRGDSFLRLNILRTANFASGTPMTVLVDRLGVDQPYIQATTVTKGSGTGKDRVYVGLNEYSLRKQNGGDGKTATVDRSLDAATAAPPAGFESLRLEKRDTGAGVLGQNGPQIRPAIHSDGTVYAVFYGWRSGSGPTVIADVVVVRDDAWASGSAPYSSLKDPGDGIAGVRVAKNISFTFNGTLGQDRLGGDLSIAVDPRNSAVVYIAWADVRPSTGYTLHVCRSTDRGATWSPDLLTLANTKNPSLAITPHGKIGLLYQCVTGTGFAERWETHVRRSKDGMTWDDLVLATVPANTPAATFWPYIGDYVHMMAVGNKFYGVFSANNTPDKANFPNGVAYQRNVNFASKKLLALDNTTEVKVSIDPFFFSIEDAEPPQLAYVGCEGDFHLVGDTATGLYSWQHHRPWLVSLKFNGDDKNYWYYQEAEYPENQWAFARHGDSCGRFAVWFMPGDKSNRDWMFYEYAKRIRPIHTEKHLTTVGY